MAIISIILLVLSYLSFWIPPHVSSLLPLMGLAYPFVMPVVAGLLVLAALMKSRAAWLLAVIWCIGLPHFFSYYQFFNGNESSLGSSISDSKFMSWNVNLLGYNKANQLVKMKSEDIRDSIVKVLELENPDVIAFQEFLQTNELDHIGLIKSRIGYPFHHVKFSTSKRSGRKTGLVLFSKFPIVQSGQVVFSGTTLNGCIFIDILKNQDTLRIYNLHLQSIRFGAEDYEFLEEDKEELTGVSRIVSRLRKAFIRREDQVHAIREHMKSCGYPMIVMGDFNDPPMSYTYRVMSEDMVDAFREKGKWMSSTYAGKFPNFRIDYIMTSEDAGLVSSYQTLPIELIDHRPVVVTVQKDVKSN